MGVFQADILDRLVETGGKFIPASIIVGITASYAEEKMRQEGRTAPLKTSGLVTGGPSIRSV